MHHRKNKVEQMEHSQTREELELAAQIGAALLRENSQLHDELKKKSLRICNLEEMVDVLQTESSQVRRKLDSSSENEARMEWLVKALEKENETLKSDIDVYTRANRALKSANRTLEGSVIKAAREIAFLTEQFKNVPARRQIQTSEEMNQDLPRMSILGVDSVRHFQNLNRSPEYSTETISFQITSSDGWKQECEFEEPTAPNYEASSLPHSQITLSSLPSGMAPELQGSTVNAVAAGIYERSELSSKGVPSEASKILKLISKLSQVTDERNELKRIISETHYSVAMYSTANPSSGSRLEFFPLADSSTQTEEVELPWSVQAKEVGGSFTQVLRSVVNAMKGMWLLKHTRKNKTHPRFVRIDPFNRVLFWCASDKGAWQKMKSAAYTVLEIFSEDESFEATSGSRKFRFQSKNAGDVKSLLTGIYLTDPKSCLVN